MSSITNLISVGVNGTGTANSVMKWLDADTATDSIIYDNGTNIGIGTSSPANYAGYTNVVIDNTSGGNIDLNVAGTRTLALTSTSTAAYVAAVANIPLVLSTNNLERMRIDNAGNVGIGTTPAAWNSTSNVLQIGSFSSISQQHNGSINIFSNAYESSASAFSYLASTYAGRYNIDPNNGVHSWYTAASGTAGTGVSWLERMRIASGGEVLIGTTTSYGSRISTFESGNKYMFIENHTQSGAQYFHLFRYNGSDVGSIVGFNTSTSYNTSSDYRLKENVVPMTGALDRVDALKPSRFNFIIDPNKTVDGFLAHQVQEVVPEAITGEKDAVDAEGNPVYQGIDQSKLVPLLTAAIQELKAEIETLKSQING